MYGHCHVSSAPNHHQLHHSQSNHNSQSLSPSAASSAVTASMSHHLNADCAINLNGTHPSQWPFLSPAADPFGVKLHYSDYLVMALPPSPPDAHHLTASASPSMTSSLSGAPQKDTTFTKIFVGGLPYHTTDKSLRQFFEAFGEIEEAVVITDRQTGKSRGYGFVTMADRESAERAVKEANPIIDGRKANVNLAYLGAKPRSNAQNGFPFPIRTGYPTVLPAGQYGLPPHHYLYHPAAAASPYLTAPPGLLLPPPPPTAALSPTHFFDYPTSAYPPPPPYATTNGYDPPAYASFHATPSHPSGAIGPAAVAAAVAAAATNGTNSANSGIATSAAAAPNVHGYSYYGAPTNGHVNSSGNSNYMTGAVTPATTVSFDAAARI